MTDQLEVLDSIGTYSKRGFYWLDKGDQMINRGLELSVYMYIIQ